MGYRPVDHGPAPSEAYREKSGILILGRKHRSKAFEPNEVVGAGKSDQWASLGKGRVRYGPEAQFLDVSDPRIFNPPCLFGVRSGRWQKGRLMIDGPVMQAVTTAGDREMGHPPPVLNPHEEERFTVDGGCSGVENRVGPVGETRRCDNGIPRISLKKVLSGHHSVHSASRPSPQNSSSKTAGWPVCLASRASA